MVKAVFLMADYGHDPTEAAIPHRAFKDAGFQVDIATENGDIPDCDDRMLTGITQKLLGATQEACEAYSAMKNDITGTKPLAWTDPEFTLESYDLVFLPGGHEKGVRQLIDSTIIHKHLAQYFPSTLRPSTKTVAAVCHGVLVLAESTLSDGMSVLHDATTTALPGMMEQGIFWATRPFLGDYYKTYGAGSDSVQTAVSKQLDNPEEQYFNSLSSAPFVHEDQTYNYISARFPPDAKLLAQKSIALVQANVM